MRVIVNTGVFRLISLEAHARLSIFSASGLMIFSRLLGFSYTTLCLSIHLVALSPRKRVTPMAVYYHQKKLKINIALPVYGSRPLASIIAVLATLDAVSSATYKLFDPPATCFLILKLRSFTKPASLTGPNLMRVDIPKQPKLRCKIGALSVHALSAPMIPPRL